MCEGGAALGQGRADCGVRMRWSLGWDVLAVTNSSLPSLFLNDAVFLRSILI